MIRFLQIVVLAAFFAVASFSAQAAESRRPVPDALKPLEQDGAQVEFMGSHNGMDGWIAVKGGQPQFFYFTPDGSAFVTGLMFSSDGKSLTIKDVQNLQQSPTGQKLDMFVSQPNTPTASDKPITVASPSEKLIIDVERANWIPLGNKDAPFVYMFVDPQCPYCKAFMKDLRKDYIEKGLIQVRIVPVGLSAERMAQAAFLLASPNPQELWYKHLDGDEKALPVQTDLNEQGVQRNLSVMQSWKLDVTPLTVYRAADGKVKIIQGRGKNIPALIADLPKKG